MSSEKTYEEKRAYLAHHCENRTIGQCAKYLGISRREVMSIYDTVFNLPRESFPKPDKDGLINISYRFV